MSDSWRTPVADGSCFPLTRSRIAALWKQTTPEHDLLRYQPAGEYHELFPRHLATTFCLFR